MASLWLRLRKLVTISPKKRATTRSRRHSRSGSRLFGVGRFERLESREMLTVTYHGGALLTHVEAQSVFMGSDWASSSALTSQSASLNTYVAYLVNSPYMDMLTNAGYNVGRGSATTGQTLDLSLNKTTTGVSDTEIHTNLQNAINAGQLATPDANRLYVVYVEPGVIVKLGRATSRTSFLGYHGAFAGRTAGGQSADIRYAVMPYPGTPNPSPSSQGYSNAFDELTSVSSHEIAEAATDPDVNYKTLGWYDDQLDGEIADLTRQTTRLNGYLVQDVVDKNDHVIAPPPDTGSAGSGGTTTLTAPSITSLTAASSTSVQIAWTSVTGASGYRVLQVQQDGTTTQVASLGAGATSATISGLTAGSRVTFKVEAFNSTSTADSASASVTLPTPLSPPSSLAAPQVTAAAISSTRVQLKWTAVTGAQGYRIYWWNGFRAVLLGTLSAGATSVQITGLRPGTTSQFLVEAFGGGMVADSAWVSVIMPSRLAGRAGSARNWLG